MLGREARLSVAGGEFAQAIFRLRPAVADQMRSRAIASDTFSPRRKSEQAFTRISAPDSTAELF
jgi:hypothetical protein